MAAAVCSLNGNPCTRDCRWLAHTPFPLLCTFFDQHCPTTQVLHKSRIFFTHTMPTAFWRGCFLGQLGPSQRRLPLPSKTLAPFHEELAFCFACGCWLLSCLLWCCGPTRTRTPNLAGSLQPEAPRLWDVDHILCSLHCQSFHVVVRCAKQRRTFRCTH